MLSITAFQAGGRRIVSNCVCTAPCPEGPHRQKLALKQQCTHLPDPNCENHTLRYNENSYTQNNRAQPIESVTVLCQLKFC